MGFEPATASLEGWNSTTELRPPTCNQLPSLLPMPASRRHGRRNFTARFTMHNSASEPLTLRDIFIKSIQLGMVGRQGFEPWKP